MRKGTSASGPMILSAVLLLLLISHTAAIDCMKYVFAPKCRGISAKRGAEPVAKYPSMSDSLDSEYGSPADYVSDSDSYGLKLGRIPDERYSNTSPAPAVPLDQTNTEQQTSGAQNRYLKALLRMYLDRRADDYEV